VKPELLLAWGNTYNFDGLIVPLVPKLARAYRVFVMLVDHLLAPRITAQLERWKDDGTISGYSIAPDFQDTWRLHLFMAIQVRRLRRRNFRFFVSLTMMQVWERYLLACALPPEAVRLCFFPQTTNLLNNEEMMRRLLDGKRQEPIETHGPPPSKPAPPLSARRALRRLADAPGLAVRLDLLTRYVRAICDRIPFPRIPFPRLPTANYLQFLNRNLLPALLVGKTFPLGEHDWFTQIGTDQFDAVAFLDPLEARAHAALFGNPNMFVVEHPALGNCRCGTTSAERRAILSPLSGLMGRDSIPLETLEVYRRDLTTALRETGANEIHLRLHPNETGNWPRQLAEFLNKSGVPARIVDATLPIREMICDYAGMVGFASGTLRDARGSCDYAFLVGMVAASKTMFPNPKLLLGESEGVDWIEEDGTFAPGIFQRRLYHAPARTPLGDLLTERERRKRLAASKS
jgi:hypothetical protein